MHSIESLVCNWSWFWLILRRALLILSIVRPTDMRTNLLIDQTGDIFTGDGCARDPYFCVPAETQSLHINIFC